ncbi:SdrD B-like domain-containing protein [Lewinella sp. LCG006]|uniref:SdrD B-like domain-containing protein n=1 Tax=Lewinella sp. LCG006 TaxID=3231911 RepID=UPI00345FF917
MTKQLPWKQAFSSLLPTWMLLLALCLGGSISLHAQLQVSFSVTDAYCFGLPNGSVTATASGGVPAYAYQWSNGQTGATITGLAAGTYFVTVTDAAAQTTTSSVVVNQPTQVTATLTADDVCSDPFTITANPMGGVPPYSYNWSNGAMTQTITNVTSGQYCVTIVDSHLCGPVTCITVNVNPPSVSVNTGSVTCPGGSNGSLTAFPSSGQPPYTYAWSNGASGQTIFGLTAGTYTVTLTDANGCTDSATGFVSQPPPIVINLNGNNPNCIGDTNGSVFSTISGGTPPYSLSWNTGANTPNIFNLSAGTYVLTVVDNNGCVQTASITLANNSNLTLGGLGTPETCPGANNGFATANPQGGVMPYSYQWSNGVTQQVVTNAAPGNYGITVTDAAGCVATTIVNVPAAPAFTVVAAGSNPSTCGASNGSATAIITQGVGPFSFSWNTGATTQTINNLAPGTYSVTVTNGNGCLTSASTTLVAPPDVFVSITGTPILCPGSTAGTATAVVTGGTAPFTFNWSNGASGQTISGLSAGNYSVIVTDANGCNDIASITIQQSPGVTFTLTGTNTVCGVGNTGSASATPTSGTPPFSFLWNTGATSAGISGLVEGTYTVTVTDDNGCSATQSIFINIIDDLIVTTNGSGLLCAGENTGSATAFPSGGNAPYSFAWSNGANTQTINGLAVGVYTVVITDANGCTAQNSFTVTAPPALQVSIQATNPVNCFGAADATLTATASGGTPGYSYAWSNGQTGATITGLPAGVYTVTATDVNECEAVASFTVSQAQEIDVVITGETIVCGTEDSGFAGTIVIGGVGPFVYNWSTGATTESVSNLVSGTYSVTVTDANGCTGTESITINVISDFAVNLIPRDALCFGDNNGSVLAIASGGTMPYSYLWSNGQMTNEITGLTAGTYSVTVTEANGCVVETNVTVGQPQLLTAVANGNNPACPGDTNGSATVTPNGGTGPYQYSWSNGAISNTINGLGAGTYTVTVTDANLCTTTASVTLSDPPALNVNVTAPTITCGGTATGTATAIVTGGTGMYTYLWSDGQTTQAAVNLAAGTYSVTVTDANGCSAVVSAIVVNELPAINIDFNVTNLECTTAPVGAITASATNGTAPYTFSWSNGQSGPTITNLTAGVYTVTVTDASGCQAVRSAEITQTAGFTAGAPGTMVTCFGANDGTANVVTNGGQAPFAYNWSNGGITQMITGLAPGTYSVTVIDANECFATASVVITQPALLVANLNGVNLDCGGDADGSATVTPSGGTPPFIYAWSNGQVSQTINGLSGGVYTVTVTDSKGCQATNMITITEPTPLVVNVTQNSGTCSNVNQGILVANVSGGTPAYSYIWSNGATTATVSNLAPGTYGVTVTDANGCVQTAFAAVTTFPAPSCSVTEVQPSTLGNNGILMVNVTSGTAPFSYSWSNGANTATITDLAPGTYTVTVTDTNGCQTTCSATLEALSGIGNYVWEDIDHDGQQDDNEPAISGVTVNLKDVNGVVIATTVTNDDGEYYFLGLDPGSYSIQFVIPDGFDYTASNQGDDALDSDIVPGMNGMTGIYVLDPGEIDLTVDGGIYVPPNGVIGDPCTCLNNSTTEDNGQFTETFTVYSYPNETWTIIDGTGMYEAINGEPPVDPVHITYPQVMTEVEPGVYEFTFRLVDEITYSVVTTNNFDTLSITNTCEYPTLNINELPPTTLCLSDAPIELGANPNIPGNMIFTINGVISTTIDPIALNAGSYELVATLIPLDPEECEATVITQFTITEDCLAEVGNRVWLDLNCDGIQGGNEPGIPGVEVTITGTAEFLDPNVNMTTFTDANGNYSFMVPPGNYKLTFGAVPGYEPTAPNQGNNDEVDSDVNPLTLMTDFFHLDAYETNLSFDYGLCPECVNITYPGAIGYNQYLCAPGNDPEPFVSLAEPTGGDGPVEYMWMYTNGLPGTPIQYWTPIPNSNSPTYDAGPLFYTTYFARCARTEDCGPFLESNILVVEVGDETEAIINGPNLVCYNEPTTFVAEDVQPGSQVTWNFTGGATPSTVNGTSATVTWSNIGIFQVELIVTYDGCTAYAYKTITMTTSPTVCDQGLVIDTEVMNPDAGDIMVSWEMNTNTPGLQYHVEHSNNGVDFERIATVTEPVRQQNGVAYFEHYSQAPKRGLNYYRVEVADELNNTVYSNTEEVVLYTDSKIAMLYPNPVEDVLNLEIFETFDAQDVLLEIFAVSGKKMASVEVTNGQQQLQLDFRNYPAGAYLVRLRLGETDIRTMKVIKRK